MGKRWDWATPQQAAISQQLQPQLLEQLCQATQHKCHRYHHHLCNHHQQHHQVLITEKNPDEAEAERTYHLRLQSHAPKTLEQKDAATASANDNFLPSDIRITRRPATSPPSSLSKKSFHTHRCRRDFDQSYDEVTVKKSIGNCVELFSWILCVFLLGLGHVANATAEALATSTVHTAALRTDVAKSSFLPHVVFTTAVVVATTASAQAGSLAAAAATAVPASTTYGLRGRYEFASKAADDDDNDAMQVKMKRVEEITQAAELADTNDQMLHQNVGPEGTLDRQVSLDAFNNNEQQLLAFYRRAQYEKEQKQQQQRQQQHQQDQSHLLLQLQRHYLHDVVDFDDIVPTAGVVSTQSSSEVTLLRRHVTKRSATTKIATTAVPPTVAAAASSDVVTEEAAEEKCEPKVLDEIPSEPYYDFTDITEDAARQFTEFLANKFTSVNPPTQLAITDQMREEVRRRANGIASYALNEDENLLAFAIAAPSIHTVVVKFRDNVTIPPSQVHNKAFLGSYWRELGYAWNSTEGTQEWGAPFRDCNLLKKRWLWPFRISYAENKIKIVAAAFIAADEDVCNDGLEEIFGRRHGCDRNTTFCLLTENKPAATRDVYTCICRESFYLPNSTLQGFRGDIVELSEGFDNYSCIPCPGGCTTCDQDGACLLGEVTEVVSMESLLNVSVGTVLGACIFCCIVLIVIVFRQRKSKAIASGMWTVLETILLGIILLYASVTVHFFPASITRCLLEPWLRELGFITCYGAIILKLYRHLVDFRTRKAHRWVLRDIDLLKYLGTMVFAVTCYMAAFTASAIDLLSVGKLETLREQHTNTCQPLKWDFVTQTSEVLILCFGLHLSFASRNANTQFRERQFLVATLSIEFLVSTTFYILRYFYLPEMSPGTIFLALFLRSQLTNSTALGLIFVPKLWYQHKQVPLPMNLSIRLPVDAFKVNDPQRLGGGYAGLCLGDPDIGELTIAEMSPEDIRAELKRLYTQLEILKNKTLRQDNPHISKRRGGRKAGHRRFSLQALSAKHRSNKHHQDIEITEAEPSRTPEDSVCSVEGPTDAEISGISASMLSHSVVSHSIISHSK